MSEEEAQLDTGNTGAEAEAAVADLIGADKSPAEAVGFYGMYTLGMGGSFILLWVLLSDKTFVGWFRDGFLSRVTFYVAAGMAWLMVSFFDGPYMRTVYTDVQALSVMGPFFFHWYGVAMYLITVL